MAVIYANDNDRNAALWLRCLPLGIAHVDDRSILDIEWTDLNGFTQCHFFAGIGGWQYALDLAGWPRDLPVWTGSCPCQPISVAGKRKGEKDKRHLWPEFHRLIAECRPPVIFGEQAGAKTGREWLDGISLDLEELGYAVGSADLCAAGVGAPHIRQRHYWFAVCPDAWVGNSYQHRLKGRAKSNVCTEQQKLQAQRRPDPLRPSEPGGMGDAKCVGSWRDSRASAGAQGGSCMRSVGDDSGSPVSAGRVADAELQRTGIRVLGVEGSPTEVRRYRSTEYGEVGRFRAERRSLSPFWRYADYLYCRDGKVRPVEPGSFPMADGISGRVAQLRGLGNAIVPQVAALFIEAAVDAANESFALSCPQSTH